MNMRRLLELQADRIEAVLALHKCTVRVTGGTVTPRWVRFQVLPALGARVSKITGLAEEIAAAIDAPSVRVSRRGAALAVEVPRDDPQPVRLLPLLQQLDGEVPAVTACLGLAGDGAPLLIRLPSPDVAHVLVCGTTGSGKTVLLRAMALSLVLRHPKPHDLALVMIDPRGGAAFECFGGLPHLARPVIRGAEEATEALESLVRLMVRRDVTRESIPPVIVMIDELADLLMAGGKEIEWAMTRLTQRGRGAGIHLVAATQKPTAAVLGPLVKANFPTRLVGRVTSSEDAKVASGWSGTGAERLQGRGDFLAVAEGRVTRFQAAHVSEEEIAEVMARRGWQALPGMRRLTSIEPAPVEVGVILPEPSGSEPDPVEELADRLAPWWAEHGGEWGAKTRAVKYLFGDDTPAGGYFWEATMSAIALLEASSSTSTPQTDTPTPAVDWAAAFLEW